MCALAAALASLALFSAPPAGASADVGWVVGPAAVELHETGIRCSIPAGLALAAGATARTILDVVAWGFEGSELAVLSPTAPSRTWFVVLARRSSPTPVTTGPTGTGRREGALVWLERPSLDPQTGRTSWALAGPGAGGPTVNRHVWIPAGRGAIEATLVAPVEELAEASRQLGRILDGIEPRGR